MSFQLPSRDLASHRPSIRLFVLTGFLAGLGLGVAVGYFMGRANSRQEAQPAPATADPASATTAPEATSLPAEVNQLPQTGFPSKQICQLDLSISSSLNQTLAQRLQSRQADILNAQLGRILVWWFDLRRDVLKQDRVQVLYRPAQDPAELQTLAVRYLSQKKRQTYTAYLFKPAETPYSRYYDPMGQEVEHRLENGPIKQYEQITELLNLAGRRHRGVDFKTNVGTPVVASFRAKVIRRNWNTRRNGYCLELRYMDRKINAIFLHLDEVLPHIRPGKQVETGTVVARTGNSGNSTAPHLHYELHSASGRLLNPFKVHKTVQLKLGGEDLERFKVQRKHLDSMFDDEGLSRESSPGLCGSNLSMEIPK